MLSFYVIQCELVMVLGIVNKTGIFYGDNLHPLMFVLYMIPLLLVLRGVKAGYDLERGEKEI